jgi:8-oxo-dGTP pyrophosphatase MutT (NUDIX family)
MDNNIYTLISKDRLVRCQGVILKNDSILILEHFNNIRDEKFWFLPGGGMELGESEEECLHRELKEETNLDVEINHVLFDDIKYGLDYKRYVTFLCTPLANSIEKIGNESNEYKKITKLTWLSINDEESWSIIQNKEQFYPSLKQIKDKILKLNYYNKKI